MTLQLPLQRLADFHALADGEVLHRKGSAAVAVWSELALAFAPADHLSIRSRLRLPAKDMPMKPTEFWSWSLRSLEGRARYVIRGKYNEAMATSYWQDRAPEKVPGSGEIRDLPESPEEVLMNTPEAWRNYPSAPPRNAQIAPE